MELKADWYKILYRTYDTHLKLINYNYITLVKPVVSSIESISFFIPIFSFDSIGISFFPFRFAFSF